MEQGALVIGVQPGEIDGQDAGGLDGGQLVGEVLHGRRRGLGRVGLDRLEAGSRLPLLHLQQAVEGLHHAGRKTPGQFGNDVFAGPLPLLPDQPQQRRLGGEEDAPLLEELAGPGQQRSRLLQARRFLEDEAFQGHGFPRAVDGQLEVVPNALLVLRRGVLPGRVVRDPPLIDTQLERDEVEQLVADLQGLLRGEAVEETDEADLIGEPQAVVVAAALGDLGQVSLGQGGVADHLLPREARVSSWAAPSGRGKRALF